MSALISDRGIVTLESTNGLWRAKLHPVGASLVALDYDGTDIVVSPNGQPFFAFAGATLAPWPNRLEDGTWIFSDKTLKHLINDERGHNANHGLVFDREFEVTAQSSSAIELVIELGHDAVYPFAVSVRVRYELGATGLTSTISATSSDVQLIPIAFGAHPYLVLDEQSIVELNAREIYAKSSRSLPLSILPIEESSLAKRGANLARDLEIDDCLTALEETSDSKYSTRITRPLIGKTVELWQDKLFDHLMVFSLREESGRMTLAVEPQTAPANAFRSHQGLSWLAPDETLSASWGISLQEGIAID